MKAWFPLVAAGALMVAAPLAAQAQGPKVLLEARGGAVVPTFDIADVAKTGASFGGTIGYQFSPKWALLGEFDYGMHKDKNTGLVDIKTTHLVAKLGYAVTPYRERGWNVMLNLGAGLVNFSVEGAPESFTYPAINAGAKLAYNFNPSVAFVLSPQGDIAFSKESELGTSNAWVWPVTAGFRFNF